MMEKPWDEPLPESELENAKRMTDVQVVFDVGARTSLDYLKLWPDAEYHLFEPLPKFYLWLEEATKDMKNVHVNPYGLSDREETLSYHIGTQSFFMGTDVELPLKTLDWYIEENKIDRIDFLKIDTERWDYRVLQGGSKAIGMARYIQYETWNDPENAILFSLTRPKYDCVDIGLRNMFCTLKT